MQLWFDLLLFVLCGMAPLASGFAEAQKFNVSVKDLAAYAELRITSRDCESSALMLRPVISRSLGFNKKQGVLCSTFIKWKENGHSLLLGNINHTQHFCNWLVVVYNSEERTNYEMEQSLARHAQEMKLTLPLETSSDFLTILTAPHKEDSLEAFQVMCNNYVLHHLHSESLHGFDPCFPLYSNESLSVYNPLLYSKATLLMLTLEFLPKYQYLWFLDSDLDLLSLDLRKYQETLHCAFVKPPLISQPLISENTQFYRYLHKSSWKNTKALASAVGFIEIQAPLFETTFLEWFILSFIVPLVSPMVVLGADWGIDELFCTAANQFRDGKFVDRSRSAASSPVCAVMIDDMNIHHRNNGEIAKSVGMDTKTQLNFALMHMVHQLFPRFAHDGLRYYVDPFNIGTRYKKVYKLRNNCTVSV
jgi:hypothetical protein